MGCEALKAWLGPWRAVPLFLAVLQVPVGDLEGAEGAFSSVDWADLQGWPCQTDVLQDPELPEQQHLLIFHG